jgi:hypothetical protein
MVSVMAIGCAGKRNTIKYHQSLQLGLSKTEFIDTIHQSIELMDEYRPSNPALKGYSLFKAEVPIIYDGSIYYYLFKDERLVYYNTPDRFLFHENSDYRQIAEEAYNYYRELED